MPGVLRPKNVELLLTGTLRASYFAGFVGCVGEYGSNPIENWVLMGIWNEEFCALRGVERWTSQLLWLEAKATVDVAPH